MQAAIPYRITRSDRARRIRVTVHSDANVEVILPRRAAEREAERAIRELRPWIERRLAEARAAQEVVASRVGTVPFLGSDLRLVVEPGRQRVHRRGDDLLIPEGDARDAIERWYRRMARDEFAWRLDRDVARLGATYSKLTIRGQKTRWGSCTSKGAMSFNWRLLLAPEEVADYVVWHEACHLKVLDHSPRFWALVASGCPDYKAHVRWLRRHGATLVL